MTTDPTITLSTFSAMDIEANLDELAGLLQACVADGASVNFVLPYSPEDAKNFWRKKVLPRMPVHGRRDDPVRGTGDRACPLEIDVAADILGHEAEGK